MEERSRGRALKVAGRIMPVDPGFSPEPVPLLSGLDFRVLPVRELKRRGLNLTASGLDPIVQDLASRVHAMAVALVPEDPGAAPRVTLAVFQTLAVRGPKLGKRTLLPVWLLQTTLIAARHERRCLRLPRSGAEPSQLLLLRLNRLPAKRRDIIVLRDLFGAPEEASAAALRLRLPRAAKRRAAGLRQLDKALKKSGQKADAVFALLAGSPAQAPLDLPALREELSREQPGPSAPVKQAVRAWRWIRLRAFVRRTLAAVGGVACVLGVCFAVFVYLATHGYLTAFFIRMGQRQAFKNHPELLVPARPWPSAAEDRAALRSGPPRTSDELFQRTNIWPVRLTFAPDQWKGIEPTRVPPVREMFQNGRIILRNPKAKRSGLAGVLGFQFNWVEARLDFAGQPFEKVGVRYRGNGTYLNSLYGPKQSLKLDVSKFEKGQELAGIHELNFLNTIVDYSYVHDVLAEDLFHELGAIGPRTAYAYITLDTGQGHDEPRGLFVAIENIDGDFAKNRFGTRKAPVFKPVTYDLFQDLGDDWAAYEKIYDLKTKATPEQQQRVIDFAKLVTHASDAEFARKLPDFLDLDEFAAFVGGHVLLSSYDGFLVNGQNYYMYLDPRSNKFGFVPWDQDHSWGDFGHIGSCQQRETASIWSPSTYDFHFLNRVMKVEAFRAVYRQKLEHALETAFRKDVLYPKIDSLARVIRPAVAAESDFRLKRFDQAVSGEWLPGPRDGQAEGPDAPVHQIKRFIENRIVSVRAQLDGKSEGARMTGFR